ncbi:primosomal protein N' [Helicobacter saguini]|uniref:Replication restart protein PriA n=2 Tax=Helicobacter saguini TaxID=1548018 RepID=A0A347VU83_9HELI|nr:primosomal protein N' [Helicobacter saguini]MWV66732.1 primosomal protein N' [Helicobacter saguini]MWV69083.1 primosomal protein N' [Helicobacter saguini]MWV71363.1 primosomal protein N' [Helicobacter saguini]TLD94045.1 primosomal protein N' [Helicobacter saguini]
MTQDSKIYILVDIIGAKLFSLTYFVESSENIKVNDIVNVTLQNRKCLGIVREILDSKNYNFKVLKATKSAFFLTPLQLSLLDFIAKYYVVHKGITASLFTLASNSPRTQSLRELDFSLCDSQNRLVSAEKSTQPANLTHDARIANHKTACVKINKSIESNNINNKKLENIESNNLQNLDSKLDSINAQDSSQMPTHRPTIDIESNLKTLSKEQEAIFNEALKKNLSLIFGATGSGKTEIYFHLMNETLKQNKEVLLLMPEISLTPQMKKRLESAFPNINEIWHSKKSAKKKSEILENLQNKKIKIIAGARSALFLPYQNLGLIIVDEEHDSSYKSNSNPKYNARDLAMYLSTKGVKVVLGSATPSVKSYYLANLNHYLLNLDSKFYNSAQEIIYEKAKTLESSQVIINEIISTLNSKKQSIIFVPTRANFKILLCRNCGSKFTCPNCSISLSVHNKTNSLVCHYCNFSRSIPSACEACGSDDLSGMRFGTEEIKKQLENILLFYDLAPNIAIFDRDNVSTEKKLEAILSDFNSQKIDILIGTQMIAKGHDYHNVALSVILGVDFMLNMPDFAAIENTFSLIFQVIGRSGRKESGKSIIQSSESSFINSMIRDFRLVLEYEIKVRFPLYPPFSRLALITFSHKIENTAKNLSYEFANILGYVIRENETIESKVEIVGISQASIPKIKNKFYYQILLRSKEKFALQKLLQKALKIAPKHILDSIDIDIDPLNI